METFDPFSSLERFDLVGKRIEPLKICLIGGAGFIGSHLCERLTAKTPHKVSVFDVSSRKIDNLLEPSRVWADRIRFFKFDIKDRSQVEAIITESDLVINLSGICMPSDYNTSPLDTIYSNFVDVIPVVECCSANKKRLIHFSSCEVYGKTVGSFLPNSHPLRKDPNFYVLKEGKSPFVLGPVKKQRWCCASAQQMTERLIYAEGMQNGLQFTIVRPFNWIGPRMDFIPGIDGPMDGIPRVIDCFSNNLLRREQLKLVDGGQSRRTFLWIKDAIDAIVLMIENPTRANGQIFDVGNPSNEITIKRLANLMVWVFAMISCRDPIEVPTTDVSSEDFYGEGYDDSDKRIPDVSKINDRLGWSPNTTMSMIIHMTLSHQYIQYWKKINKDEDTR